MKMLMIVLGSFVLGVPSVASAKNQPPIPLLTAAAVREFRAANPGDLISASEHSVVYRTECGAVQFLESPQAVPAILYRGLRIQFDDSPNYRPWSARRTPFKLDVRTPSGWRKVFQGDGAYHAERVAAGANGEISTYARLPFQKIIAHTYSGEVPVDRFFIHVFRFGSCTAIVMTEALDFFVRADRTASTGYANIVHVMAVQTPRGTLLLSRNIRPRQKVLDGAPNRLMFRSDLKTPFAVMRKAGELLRTPIAQEREIFAFGAMAITRYFQNGRVYQKSDF